MFQLTLNMTATICVILIQAMYLLVYFNRYFKWLKCLPLNPGIVGSSPKQGYDHDSLCDTSTCWFQEADSRVIYIRCDNLFRAKINMFKLMKLDKYNSTSIRF